jgi:hypothetical protein
MPEEVPYFKDIFVATYYYLTKLCVQILGRSDMCWSSLEIAILFSAEEGRACTASRARGVSSDFAENGN